MAHDDYARRYVEYVEKDVSRIEKELKQEVFVRGGQFDALHARVEKLEKEDRAIEHTRETARAAMDRTGQFVLELENQTQLNADLLKRIELLEQKR